MDDRSKSVDMLVVEATKVDGKHYDKGHVFKDCDPELAITLASAGKARLCRPADAVVPAKAAR